MNLTGKTYIISTITLYITILIGVQVEAVTVTLQGTTSLLEGRQYNPLTLAVYLNISETSATLSSVSDAWAVEIFGSSQEDGQGENSDEFTANVTQIGSVGAYPG